MRTGVILALLALLAAAMLVAAGCTATPPTNNTTATATTTPGIGTPTTTATPNATVSPAPFLGTTWEWTALEVPGRDRVTVDDPTKYTIVFSANGGYGINADCNVGGGDYTMTGTALNLTPPITTLIWCGNESQDQVFLASLANVSSYEFDGNGRLLLNLADPGNRMVFVARAAVAVTPTPAVSAPFVNSTWRWIARAGSEPVQVASPDRYTIAFEADGTYALRADCNTGGGSYTVDGAMVRISPGTLTEAYCGDASLDRTYLASLGRVTGYQMEAPNRLVLLMANPNERLVFERTG